MHASFSHHESCRCFYPKLLQVRKWRQRTFCHSHGHRATSRTQVSTQGFIIQHLRPEPLTPFSMHKLVSSVCPNWKQGEIPEIQWIRQVPQSWGRGRTWDISSSRGLVPQQKPLCRSNMVYVRVKQGCLPHARGITGMAAPCPWSPVTSTSFLSIFLPAALNQCLGGLSPATAVPPPLVQAYWPTSVGQTTTRYLAACLHQGQDHKGKDTRPSFLGHI